MPGYPPYRDTGIPNNISTVVTAGSGRVLPFLGHSLNIAGVTHGTGGEADKINGDYTMVADDGVLVGTQSDPVASTGSYSKDKLWIRKDGSSKYTFIVYQSWNNNWRILFNATTATATYAFASAADSATNPWESASWTGEAGGGWGYPVGGPTFTFTKGLANARYVITDTHLRVATDLKLDNGSDAPGGTEILAYAPKGTCNFTAPIAAPALSGVSTNTTSTVINYFIEDLG